MEKTKIDENLTPKEMLRLVEIAHGSTDPEVKRYALDILIRAIHRPMATNSWVSSPDYSSPEAYAKSVGLKNV